MATGYLLPQDPQTGGVTSEHLTFELPPVMTIEAAESLAAELKQLPLTENTTLHLDASRVEHITTPCLQLIVSLGKTLAIQGGSLTIQGQKDSFTRAFRDTGLESLLT